jgi:hypothetical protein
MLSIPAAPPLVGKADTKNAASKIVKGYQFLDALLLLDFEHTTRRESVRS